MGTLFNLIKPYLMEMIDIEKIKATLVFLLTLGIISIFSTNIESYDCTINGNYYDSSYLCVINDYGNYINTFISMFDINDTTEIDEVIMVISIYIFGEIIVSINDGFYEFFKTKIKPNIILLSISCASLISVFIIKNWYLLILFFIFFLIYSCLIYKNINIKKIDE